MLLLPSPGSSSPRAQVLGHRLISAPGCFVSSGHLWCPADQGMKYLIPAGETEVGDLHQEPRLAVGQKIWERVKVVWEGWRKWWMRKGNLLASSRACLGLPRGAGTRCPCCVPRRAVGAVPAGEGAGSVGVRSVGSKEAVGARVCLPVIWRRAGSTVLSSLLHPINP